MAGRKNSSIFSQPIPIRRPDHRVAREAEMFVVVIIGNDEHDVGLLARGPLDRRPGLANKDQDTNKFEKKSGIHVKL